MDLNQLRDFLNTLADKSGGGVTSKPVAPQGIAGVAVFLRDGQVIFVSGGEGR